MGDEHVHKAALRYSEGLVWISWFLHQKYCSSCFGLPFLGDVFYQVHQGAIGTRYAAKTRKRIDIHNYRTALGYQQINALDPHVETAPNLQGNIGPFPRHLLWSNRTIFPPSVGF